jgi:hypothetical protein
MSLMLGIRNPNLVVFMCSFFYRLAFFASLFLARLAGYIAETEAGFYKWIIVKLTDNPSRIPVYALLVGILAGFSKVFLFHKWISIFIVIAVVVLGVGTLLMSIIVTSS